MLIFFPLGNINRMTLYKDTMLYFNKLIHVYGCNLSILWSPLKNPKNLQLPIFGTQFLNSSHAPGSNQKWFWAHWVGMGSNRKWSRWPLSGNWILDVISVARLEGADIWWTAFAATFRSLGYLYNPVLVMDTDPKWWKWEKCLFSDGTL